MADATIIMAGGSGTRLWPASTAHRPKQLLRIGGGLSLIQQAVLRAAAVTPSGPILIVTHVDHVAGITEHVRELAEHFDASLPARVRYLAEPVGRNTAPAIAYGVWSLAQTLLPEAVALVLTADHVIEPVERFAADAERAAGLAAAGSLVCFGIVPTRPETGYGYIHAGGQLGDGFTVESFREKPDRATAEAYLAAGGYLWNSGMFAFTLERFQAELGTGAPEIARAFTDAAPLSLLAPERLRSLYESLPKISVDYAMMEKSSRVAVVPSSFTWNDVGIWDEAATIVTGAADGPVPAGGTRAATDRARSGVIEVEASGNYVDSDLPVAICGVSDLLVIVRNGKVLVCRRGASQLVKEVVEIAERDGLDRFLADPQ